MEILAYGDEDSWPMGLYIFWPMGMKILGLWGWRFFAASCFFLEHKTVFREAEDTGTGNSLRGAERLLHKPKLLMLMTEPHYRGPWIISLRQPQQLLLDCQGSDRHPTVCPSTQTLRMSCCCWINMVRQMSWRRACFFLSEIAAGQGWVMKLSC